MAQLLGLIDVAGAAPTRLFSTDSELLRMLDQSIQLWRDAFDFLPPHDMAARMYRAIWIDTVDDVGSEMDSVTIADILPARCAYPTNECQSTDGMCSREARAQ